MTTEFKDMTTRSYQQSQTTSPLYEHAKGSDFSTKRANDRDNLYEKDDIDNFQKAVDEAKESKDREDPETDAKTIMMSMHQINFTKDLSVAKIESHRLSDGNQKLIDEINRVVDLITINSSKVVGPDVKISVKQNILQETEISLSQLQNGKIQVHFEANDIRAVQTIALYKDMLAERLGDSYQISVKDGTTLDLGQNSDHESSTKQEASPQEESDQKSA